MIVTVTRDIDDKDVADLLCGALEGGSNHWYMIERLVEPSIWKQEDRPTYSTPEEAERHADFHFYHWYPFNPGGALIITDIEGEDKTEWKLDEAAIKAGLQAMANKYPRHFNNFIDENWDAITADVFLQCCLFGEIVYG